jgi:hypothetical protein
MSALGTNNDANSKGNFGLQIADDETTSGCLMVKSASGKAAECGIRKNDLICHAEDVNLKSDSLQTLTDSTVCSVFTVRRHSDPCLLVPVKKGSKSGGKFVSGLRLKLHETTRENDAGDGSNVFSVESVAAGSALSNYAIYPGDWLRSINGNSTQRKDLDEVHALLSSDGFAALELCKWSNAYQLPNLPKHNRSRSSMTDEGNWNIEAIFVACTIGAVVIFLFFLCFSSSPSPPPPSSPSESCPSPGNNLSTTDALKTITPNQSAKQTQVLQPVNA